MAGLSNGRCYKYCPQGYITEVNPMGGDKCVKCAPNCKTCRGRSFCSVCDNGYWLHKGFAGQSTGRCINGCDLIGGNYCPTKCLVPNCQSCPDKTSGKCARCNPYFYKLSTRSLMWPFKKQFDFCFSRCPLPYVPKTVAGVRECHKVVLPEPTTIPEPSAEPEITEEPTTKPESTTVEFDTSVPTTESTTTPEEPTTEPDSWWTTPEPEATTPEEPTTEPDSSTTPEPSTTPESITGLNRLLYLQTFGHRL
ncbi:R-spondin-3 [Desmophyllum pertusum]|uniref:R-spondin-3 n=1 Tax=Desmophyllum pertusum TaxID=174260 RepID=A0A9X0A2M9_9CNID|nr:R-spondin-3 [Desmophyllum pertusum]